MDSANTGIEVSRIKYATREGNLYECIIPSEDGKYFAHLCPNEMLTIYNLFNGKHKQFDLGPFVSTKRREPVERMYFIDKRNLLLFHLKDEVAVIMMFELDFETESARLKYEYFDNPAAFNCRLSFQRNEDRLLVIKTFYASGVLEYNLYKIDVNVPLIEKYYQAQSLFMDPECSGLFENKVLSFAYAEKTRDILKTLYCFDLAAKKMDKIELDLLESMNEIDRPDTRGREFWGTWIQSDFYGVIYYEFGNPPDLCEFICHFSWTSKKWNPVVIPIEKFGWNIVHPYIDSKGTFSWTSMWWFCHSGKHRDKKLLTNRFYIKCPDSLFNLTTFAANRFSKISHLPTSLKASICAF